MINNVTLLGRLTAAPELKTTTSGINVTAFCIAVDRRFQKDGERQADFINCVAWRNTAEFINRYFTKGDPIAITGEIQTRKYTDKDGNNRVAVEVVINNVSFCGGKNNNAPATNEPDRAEQFKQHYEALTADDDDLPF